MSPTSADSNRYAELFRVETREHLAEADAALLVLEQSQHDGTAAGPMERDSIATLFRAVHTIKGMAAAMGYRAVEQVSHALESTLEHARSGSVSLSSELIGLLFEATDVLSTTVADSESGIDDVDRDDVQSVVRRLAQTESARKSPRDSLSPSPSVFAHAEFGHGELDIAGFESAVGSALGADGLRGNGKRGAEHPAERIDVPATRRTVEVRLTPDCPLKGVRAMIVRSRVESLARVRSSEPAQAQWQEDQFDGVFALTVDGDTSAADIEAAVRGAGDVARVEIRATVAQPPSRDAAPRMRYARIDVRRLDTLLDLMGELVITRDRLMREVDSAFERGAERGADRALQRVAHETSRLVSALQQEVLQARMVPVGQVFDRFPRLVRDIARDLGKDVQFVMEGRDIELDRSLLDAIGDPILHLLRNALDHGLEDAETRRGVNKPPTGRLVLRAARDRSTICIQVEDDGRGIDRDAVQGKARIAGLLADDESHVDKLDDDRLLQLLAHPGLSTAKTLSTVSGRGVGVDVVSNRVRALGGVLSLETIAGAGTVFTMRLPVTLAITRALLVQVGSAMFAIPSSHLVEAIELDGASRDASNVATSLVLRGETIPVQRLRERFAIGDDGPDGYAAIVEVAGKKCALVVDAFIAQQDVVVKPFDAGRGGAPWFSGATVLGDGTPSLIVDLGSLI